MMTHPVPNTILAQLGGARFRVMTGAKDFVGSADTLRFRLPRCKHGITHFAVRLDSDDTYFVEGCRIGKQFGQSSYIRLKMAEGITTDSLRATFTAITGLEASL